MNLESIRKIENFIRMIIDGSGFLNAKIEIELKYYPKILVHIEAGADNNLLIGYHGENLKALQYLLNIYAHRNLTEYFLITLDIGEYRKNVYKNIKHLAMTTAREVRKTGQSIKLAQMNSFERRIVHKCIAENFKDLKTKSVGENNKRFIIISPE